MECPDDLRLVLILSSRGLDCLLLSLLFFFGAVFVGRDERPFFDFDAFWSISFDLVEVDLFSGASADLDLISDSDLFSAPSDVLDPFLELVDDLLSAASDDLDLISAA